MSRIGRKPVTVPDGVTVDIKPGMVSVKGPKGELSQALSPDMKVTQSDGTLTVDRPTDRGEHRALHGLTRSLIANMVTGVTEATRSGSRFRASAIAPGSRARRWSSASATRIRSR